MLRHTLKLVIITVTISLPLASLKKARVKILQFDSDMHMLISHNINQA
jgi:hypothetical protein